MKRVLASVLAWCWVLGLASAAETTQASWYGDEHRGLPMANGRPFEPEAMSAASWFYPLGTRLRITHGRRSVIVEVTDRGPARRLVRQGRRLDLSVGAFRRLGDPREGVIRVRVERLR